MVFVTMIIDSYKKNAKDWSTMCTEVHVGSENDTLNFCKEFTKEICKESNLVPKYVGYKEFIGFHKGIFICDAVYPFVG